MLRWSVELTAARRLLPSKTFQQLCSEPIAVMLRGRIPVMMGKHRTGHYEQCIEAARSC